MHEIEAFLIALADKQAQKREDYDEPITNLADSLTIILEDRYKTVLPFDSSEIYDFFKEKLG